MADAEVELEFLEKNKLDAVADQEFETAADIRDKIEKLEESIEQLKKTWKQESKKKPVVSKKLIARTISKMTGIPVENLSASESEKLLNLEKHLGKIVIGQDKAKNQLARPVEAVDQREDVVLVPAGVEPVTQEDPGGYREDHSPGDRLAEGHGFASLVEASDEG